MSGPELITLGCRLNIAESEAMHQQLGEADDLVIVNSCAVTAEAVRQTRQAIRRAARRRPDARIVVTGCAAQTDPAMFAAMPEVSQVIGNDRKDTIRTTLDAGAKVAVADIMTVRETAPHLVAAFADRVRGFVAVQNGCDHRCTFCVIPYGRGPSRSVPAGAVVDQVKALVDQGVQEVVLTGVDVTSYGPDLPGAPSLGSLVARILASVPELPRLRLSSLDGAELDDRLLGLITDEPRFMPHIHLSLQAGSDMILKRMKRRHTRAQAVDLAGRLRAARTDIAIGADIIAGFPTETEAQFQESIDIVAECGVVHGHVFPYSPRAATPAARMPQVDQAEIKSRAARLRAACANERSRWLGGLVGSMQHVLVETSGLAGHGASFAPVRFQRHHDAGQIIAARITGLEDGALLAHGAEHG
ncbi:tRNA (N(6)-L-threonylcarbamoyladenosine(37)-C(2))-methylthiotransferase MtaB [Sphingobium sp. CR28]|uniref:tRNA (N(6)-L-threonylcarbamoyladenosine(37)-C(2))- methylthiotransferase MtaB n=1 Tax=Sphingobium sp. CR28 TaxID=3400272 RepID=UPI003FEF9A34